jgi:hypothetical protein
VYGTQTKAKDLVVDAQLFHGNLGSKDPERNKDTVSGQIGVEVPALMNDRTLQLPLPLPVFRRQQSQASESIEECCVRKAVGRNLKGHQGPEDRPPICGLHTKDVPSSVAMVQLIYLFR